MWLWTFFKGYVAIEVTGVSVERFLNMAAYRGIYIWDTCTTEDGLKMHCTIKGFRMLRDCAKKTKCRLKIVDREGFPFVMHRYRRRKILLGGIGFFILFLYIMSSFVWRIDVVGNERVPTEEILNFGQSRGLDIGTFRYFIDNKELSRQLILEFSDIGWADVYTRGTRTTITVSETIPEPQRIARNIPCNIVASQDGLITSIVTASGLPQVRQNDVVRQGDILVSGALTIETEGRTSTTYVHAYAEVWAKNYSFIQFQVPMSYTYKTFTGQERKQHSLKWLINFDILGMQQINLFHGRIPFTNYDKMVSNTQPGAGGNYPLPFIWTTATYREFIPETRHRTIDEAKAMAERIITDRIIREFEFHVDIIEKQVEFREGPEILEVSAIITTNQRIDQAVPIY